MRGVATGRSSSDSLLDGGPRSTDDSSHIEPMIHGDDRPGRRPRPRGCQPAGVIFVIRSLLSSVLIPISLIVVGAACGSDPEPVETIEEEPAPTAPEFKGLVEARSGKPTDPVIRLFWWPAKSDVPVEEVSYTVRVWTQDPSKPGAQEPRIQDATPHKLPCSNQCSLPWNETANESVLWFSVEASIVVPGDDEDERPRELESESGVVLPAVVWLTTPEISNVEPQVASPGDIVTVAGGHFLTAPVSAGALRLGELTIPDEAIEGWNNDQIRFRIPEGATSGPIVVTTPAGPNEGDWNIEVR